MRSRKLKPQFFKNEDLASCDPLARLLFAGLWCLADREGRLADRPGLIRAEILPHDNVDCEKLLAQLTEKAFIVRYTVEEKRFIWIPTFREHQKQWIHPNEQHSVIPACSIDSGHKKSTPQGTAKVPPRCALHSWSSLHSLHSCKNGGGELEPPLTVTSKPIPKNLDTPEFRETWLEYLRYRIDSGKPFTPRSAEAALKRLAAWGPQRAVAALAYTMAQGWLGVQEEKTPARNGRHDPLPAKTTEQIAADMLRRRQEAKEERERFAREQGL